ncbi:MAG TPA: trypsin-like peptidase domain-containing protein [Candidatus Deferrimicrobium sp.]|nr:trypsin-like peptidase domain-containing protein [Candidatus Deferrimicrobium sp.]
MAAAAGFCVILGILFASQLDLSPPAVAEAPLNLVQTGLYPVVERDGRIESPFVAVVESVQDAVVNVSARSREERMPWWFYGPNYVTSSGSGFFFRKDGYILTNSHVVQDAVKLTVATASGYKYEAELVGSDPMTDIAVLKIEPEEEVTVIPFGDSDALKVGDWAIAIGNPFPQQGLDRTVTVGVISAKGRSNLDFGPEGPVYQNYIQTDASINPGNSGGPLLNLRGECIGVNAAISTPSGGSVGIGFAIPINMARAVVPDLIAQGKPQRGWLGVGLSSVTERDAKRQGLDAVKGVKIDSVVANSPADKAGIKPGDIVVGVNSQTVDNASQLSVLVSTIHEGTTVPIEIVRDSKHMTLSATIGDRETYLASRPASDDGDFRALDWMGMQLMSFTPEVARALGVEFVEGVFVRRVYSGSPADRASIVKGTVILQVNKQTTQSLDEITAVARQLEGRSERVALIVQEPDGTVARKVIRQ